MNRETKRDGERGNPTTHDPAAINYFSSTTSQSATKIRFDDLIGTLANAPENRRARQVTEWERMTRPIFLR